MKVTDEQIEAAKSARGGWTKNTLAAWNVPWPPPKGWRRALRTGRAIPKRKAAGRKVVRRRTVLFWDRQWRNAMDRDA